MSGNTKRFFLPSGCTTQNLERFEEEWSEFSEPMEKRLGWSLVACSPGLVFQDKRGKRISLSTGQCLDILYALDVAVKSYPHEEKCSHDFDREDRESPRCLNCWKYAR